MPSSTRWAGHIPNCAAQADRIRKVVTEEETRFGETLDRGLELIDD